MTVSNDLEKSRAIIEIRRPESKPRKTESDKYNSSVVMLYKHRKPDWQSGMKLVELK